MCADGYLVVSAPNDRLFARLSAALGHPDWPDDPRFGTNQTRYANLSELNALIMPLLATHSRDHWADVLGEAGVPCAPVRQLTEMLADPQTEALGIVQSLPGHEPGLMGMPLSFDGTRPPLRKMPPGLGENNAIKESR